MLICLQHLSWPHVGYPAMPLARQLAHQRYVPPNPLVLGKEPLKSPAPTTDRDRPVSRRSKPSSRTAFIGEQPNPWELLHPQDAMSRHRTDFHGFRGVDYVFILLSILAISDQQLHKLTANAQHDLTFCDRSRRIASIDTIDTLAIANCIANCSTRSLSFRISRYGVIDESHAQTIISTSRRRLPTVLPSRVTSHSVSLLIADRCH